MLIRNNTLTESANSILENATYLYESEMPNISAYSIPVVANDRFNAGIVSYENISRFCENYGLDIVDGIRAVAEANNIDPNDVVVSIDESTIISDPWVVDEVHQYVVQPVSESNLVSQFTDIMVDSFLESGDDFYLEAIGEPELVLEADDDRAYADGNFVSSQDIKNQAQQYSQGMKKLKGMSTKVGDKTIKPDDPNFLVKIKRFLTDKPREYLARAVARLRQTYRKFLLRADKENDQNKIKWYKQIARKILQAVDWVLNKIQKATSINYEKRANKYAMNYADKLKDAGYGKAKASSAKSDESDNAQGIANFQNKQKETWSGINKNEYKNAVTTDSSKATGTGFDDLTGVIRNKKNTTRSAAKGIADQQQSQKDAWSGIDMDAYRKAVGGGGKTQTASGKGTNSKSVNKGGASGFGNPRANVFGSTDAETPQEKAQKQNKKNKKNPWLEIDMDAYRKAVGGGK